MASEEAFVEHDELLARAMKAEARVKELETELDTMCESLDRMRFVPDAEAAITAGLEARAEEAEALLARERACRKKLALAMCEKSVIGELKTIPEGVVEALAESAALDRDSEPVLPALTEASILQAAKEITNETAAQIEERIRPYKTQVTAKILMTRVQASESATLDDGTNE